MKYWQLETDTPDLVWLHLDVPNQSINTLNEEVFSELDHLLNRLEATPPKGLIICSDKPTGFIAGADIENFIQSENTSNLTRMIQHAHKVLQRLEDFPATTIALIEHLCLGGGLELALACNYRIADDRIKTRIGFPEIKLGIFPGFGGTQRSIERVGFLPAIQLMLSTRQLNGRQAKKIGLVDASIPARQLRNAARQCITHPWPQTSSDWKQTLAAHPLILPWVSRWLKKQVNQRINADHYPAPHRLIEHCTKNLYSREKMFQSEISQVPQLLAGDTAQNLIRVFFLQQQLKHLAPSDLPPKRHVHVIGGGVMGGDIAAWCALQGLHVTLQDRSAELLGQAYQRAHAMFSQQLKQQHLITAAMDRLIPDHTGKAVKHADVVIEAIYENIEAKQALFAKIEPQLKSNALFASNTSSIPLEQLSAGLQDPSRLIGLHFFNPVARMQLIEVIKSPITDNQWINQGLAFSRQIQRLGLPVNSCPGFLVNRILMPYLIEAIMLFDQGIEPAVIDQAAEDFGMPMGPIALADSVGLDICLAVADKLAKPLDLQIPNLLVRQVAEGKLGRKSREGFYHYDKHGKRLKKPTKKVTIPQGLTDQLILPLLNEAVSCLREHVVEDADLLDAGVIFGTGFSPFLGGPLHSIQHSKKVLLRERLIHLEHQTHHHFHADSGWSLMKV